MANKIRLRPQFISAAEYKLIKNPPGGGRFKKVFFQFKFKGFENGDAVFGLVAYGGHRKNGKKIGPLFELHDDAGADKTYSTPLIFGNLEVKSTRSGGKAIGKINSVLRSTSRDLEEVYFTLKPFRTDNPHADYIINVEGTTEELNPSPPATPSDF